MPRRAWKLDVLVRVALVALMGAASLSAGAFAAQSGEARGFRALDRQSAPRFRLPPDVRFQGRSLVPGFGLSLERYRQFYGEAEVLGAQLTVYRDNGVPTAVIGAHFPDLRPSSSVRLDSTQARAIAAASRRDGRGAWRAQLMLHPDTGRYFFRLEQRRFDARWMYWVDAETGEILNAYDALTTAEGIGVLGDTKDLTGLTSESGGSYAMLSADGRQTTYDALNRFGLPGSLARDADDVWNTPGRTSPGQPALVDAHFYARVTDDFYREQHGFDWLAHYPQGMVSSAHVRTDFTNAYWDGQQMSYGDGDGTSFIELSGDLDVVGHELSHGVTEATSGLIYQNESGALNEAFSDIMGTAIEFSYGAGNWTIGEDITIGTNGIRNLANPNEDGDPSHYQDRYTGAGDNGGVHINSGIANHWFYLLSEGGQNANSARRTGTSVPAVGLEEATRIAYEGFTALPSTANFCAARSATLAVAGASEGAVADAWNEVGVDVALCGGGGGDGLVISNVASRKRWFGYFEITWTTDRPATSEVNFTCCGAYSDSRLKTSHRRLFRGQRRTVYEYFVTSTDADGITATAGPFYHQN